MTCDLMDEQGWISKEGRGQYHRLGRGDSSKEMKEVKINDLFRSQWVG